MTAAQLVTPVNTTLYEVAYILESVGLSPLLLATLGFLRTMYVFSFSRVEIFQILIMFSSVDQQDGRYVRLWRILGLLNTIALIISIIGGTDLTSSDSSKLSQANTYRRVSTILFFVLYLVLAGIHVMCWMKSGSLMKHRRKVSCLYMLRPFISSVSHALVGSSSSVSHLRYPSSLSVSYTLCCPRSRATR